MATLTLPYDMAVKTRYLYCGPTKRSQMLVGSVYVHMNFADADGPVVVVTGDASRWERTVVYREERQSGVSQTGATGYRHVMAIDLEEGLHCSFCDVAVTKRVPSTGVLEYEGVQVVADRFEAEDEFAAQIYQRGT